MSIKIGKYVFNGPFKSTSELEDKAGVYAIISDKDNKLYPVDLGEASKVKTRIENHDRKDSWKENSRGTLVYAVHYTTDLKQPERMVLEKELRNLHEWSCGKK